MQNVIVFISPDIDYMMRDKIIKVLSLNHIEVTNNIDIATLVIQKENWDKAINDFFMKLNTKPYELVIYPPELPIIQKEKIKKYVPRNISVPEFNKVLQIRKQFLLNRTRRK